MANKFKKKLQVEEAIEILEKESPIRSIFCLKEKEDMERIEEVEDCFILDFDPSVDVKFSELSVKSNDLDGDISIVAEKGQVACRDYPHSRHLCSKNPFDKTPHENHCEMCYCYVCDSAAPCKHWLVLAHCDASDGEPSWIVRRSLRRTSRSLRRQKKAMRQQLENFAMSLQNRKKD